MHPTQITRVAQRQWHALHDDQVVGRGDTARRPDGRTFLSIDAWDDAVFDRLADAMLADLPRPLSTVVDEADLDLTARWRRAGFTTGRREWEYVVPTAGIGSVPTPDGVTMVPLGTAEEAPLRELYDTIRGEVEATVGWAAMPAEVVVPPGGASAPAKYAVAARSGRYMALLRVTGRVARQPRIGLLAVRSEEQRRGIARALLAHVLDSLHRAGVETAWAEVNESNGPAMALFESAGARRASSNLELVLR
jgi:GNAT superfamily N-acetyltransferase